MRSSMTTYNHYLSLTLLCSEKSRHDVTQSPGLCASQCHLLLGSVKVLGQMPASGLSLGDHSRTVTARKHGKPVRRTQELARRGLPWPSLDNFSNNIVIVTDCGSQNKDRTHASSLVTNKGDMGALQYTERLKGLSKKCKLLSKSIHAAS